jgi:hypothetical protein
MEEKRMLKTNSKKAQQNLRAYIVENFEGGNYSPKYDYIYTAEEVGKPLDTVFSMVAWAIWTEYRREADGDNRDIKDVDRFTEWTSGLPSVFRCDYWLGSAKEDLGNILEESESEKERFTSDEAEAFLSRIIYNAIAKITKR